MKHLYFVRSAGLGKIFCNFHNNHMVLFDIYFKCSLNVSVNSRCFCDDARKTLSLLKHKGE